MHNIRGYFLDGKYHSMSIDEVEKYYYKEEIPDVNNVVLGLHGLMTGSVNDKVIYPALTPVFLKRKEVGTVTLGYPSRELEKYVKNLPMYSIRKYYVDIIQRNFPEYVNNFFVSEVLGTNIFISWLGKSPSDFDIMVADNRHPVQYIKGKSLILPNSTYVRNFLKDNGTIHEFRGELFEVESYSGKKIIMKAVDTKTTSAIVKHILKSL